MGWHRSLIIAATMLALGADLSTEAELSLARARANIAVMSVVKAVPAVVEHAHETVKAPATKPVVRFIRQRGAVHANPRRRHCLVSICRSRCNTSTSLLAAGRTQFRTLSGTHHGASCTRSGTGPGIWLDDGSCRNGWKRRRRIERDGPIRARFTLT